MDSVLPCLSVFLSMRQDGNIVSVEQGQPGIDGQSTEISFLGYLKKELIGTNFVSLLPEGEYKILYKCLFQEASKFSQYQEQLLKATTIDLLHKSGKEKVTLSATFTELGEGASKILICFLEKVSESEHVTVATDNAGKILSCSNTVDQVFGYNVHEVIHSHIHTLLPYFEPIQESSQPLTMNLTAKHKNGGMFYVGLQLNIVHISTGVQLNNFRITKIDSSMEALLILSEANTIISCNRNVTLLFGFQPSELIGKTITSLIVPTKKRRHREKRSRAPSAGDDAVAESPSKRSRSAEDRDMPPTATLSSAHEQLMESPSSTESVQAEEEEETQLCITPFRTERESLRHRDGTLIPIDMECIPLNPDAFLSGQVSDSEYEDEVAHAFFALRIKRVELGAYWQNRKRVGEYYLLEVIGQGSFGKVRRAVHHATKQQVAVKILPQTGESAVDMQRAMREIDILMKLSHPCIIGLHQVIHHKQKLYIVMDYVHGTDLMAYIQANNGLNEKEAQRCFRQIVSALEYCHEHGVIHRDVKPKNILVDMQGNLKLIDFGMSNWIEEGKLRSTFCGTPAFASPEIILGIKYTGTQVDVWSTGVVLYLMVTGRYPFENVGEVLQSSYKDPPNISEECKDLIRSMLVVAPEQRAKLSQVKKHPWYTKDFDNTCNTSSSEAAVVTTITATISTTTIHKDRVHAVLSSGSQLGSSVSSTPIME
jgi:PAS domain-containing protein